MTPPQYFYESVDLTDLYNMPLTRPVSKNITQYNTGHESTAWSFIRIANEKDARVLLSGHDSASGLMIAVGRNTGHGPGFNPGYLMELQADGNSLGEIIQDNSPIGELGTIDFYQVSVIEHWRK